MSLLLCIGTCGVTFLRGIDVTACSKMGLVFGGPSGCGKAISGGGRRALGRTASTSGTISNVVPSGVSVELLLGSMSMRLASTAGSVKASAIMKYLLLFFLLHHDFIRPQKRRLVLRDPIVKENINSLLGPLSLVSL